MRKHVFAALRAFVLQHWKVNLKSPYRRSRRRKRFNMRFQFTHAHVTKAASHDKNSIRPCGVSWYIVKRCPWVHLPTRKNGCVQMGKDFNVYHPFMRELISHFITKTLIFYVSRAKEPFTMIPRPLNRDYEASLKSALISKIVEYLNQFPSLFCFTL